MHPYTQYGKPSLLGTGDDVTVTVLGRLTRALDRSTRAWGSGRHFPIWVTEYGYQSSPEDEFGVSHAQQAAYINFAERFTAGNGRVRSFSQYLLDDEPTRGCCGGFQTGLRTSSGKAKPAFGAFRMPLDLPNGTRARGGRITVWGDVRPARNGTRPVVRIQLNRKTIARVRAGTRGYFTARVKLPRGGSLRLSWSRFVSRSVNVRR
jgi:hypothetical protein